MNYIRISAIYPLKCTHLDEKLFILILIHVIVLEYAQVPLSGITRPHSILRAIWQVKEC